MIESVIHTGAAVFNRSKIPLFPYCFFFFFFFFFFLLLAAFESGNKRGRKEKEKREGKKNDRCSLNANISFRRVIGPDVFEEITREP